MEESRRKEDNGRQITFFDYGFDGKLDRVKILQIGRKEYQTTNKEICPIILALWCLRL
jgi:hypothetical protein